MTKVYIVRGLGMGDDEDAFENMGAFTTKEKALALIKELRQDDDEVGVETVYNIEVLTLE